jgi:hypothetical protein
MTNQPDNRPVTLDKCECASRLSRPGRLVHQAILRVFARTGQASSRADLHQVAGAAGVEPAAALAELERADLVMLGPRRRAPGRLPVLGAPTPHRLTLGSGVSVHAMCVKATRPPASTRRRSPGCRSWSEHGSPRRATP